MTQTIAVLIAISGLLFAGCSTTHQAVTWEYKTVQAYAYSEPLDRQINDLAKDGWIVVSLAATQEASNKPYVIVIFKRPKR